MKYDDKFFRELGLKLDGKRLIFIEEYYNELVKEQQAAISQKNEFLANELWAKIQTYNILKNYMWAYSDLKQKNYIDAWNLLDKIDINLSVVEKNFDLSKLFMLPFLRDIVPKYMKLFPYKFFMSRESVIKSSECSVCHKEFKLRNRCDHTPGKLYLGEVCTRVIKEISIVGISIVTNPVDRNTVLHGKDIYYDYSNLERLIEMLTSPFQWFDIDEEIIDSEIHLKVTVQPYRQY